MDSGFRLPPAPGTGTVTAGALLGGRYQLQARIAAGGMASIYRAHDTTLQRDVAVKVLHTHLADDPDLVERFRTEARHAASLLHPNIVNVFDQGVEDLPYIVMELVSGPTLRDVLLARGPLPPAEALAVLEPVCRALSRAHAAGVVHRDVKPENVLIAADGTPKVADFGIARALTDTSHTKTGTLLGSVHYIAPELVDGQEATPSSDQYAVGVILFELLTGRKPFAAETPMAVALRHTREPSPAPSTVVPGLSPALDKVVTRATQPDPGARYRDLGEVVAALRAAVPEGPRAVRVSAPGGNGGEHTMVIPAAGADTVVVAPRSRRGKPRSTPRRRLRLPRPRLPRRLLPRGTLTRRLALGLALTALLGAGGYAAWATVLAPPVAVPHLVGLSSQAALAEAEEAGLGVAEGEAEHDLTTPEGAVLRQDPAPGESLRKGRAVVVVLSAGPATVGMPTVTGMTETAALAVLARHGFDVRVDGHYHDAVPVGTVLAQVPEPDESVQEGGEVVIGVSLGIEQVTVPDLSGMDRDEAAEALAEAKLEASFVERYSDETPRRGAVISQSLESGATVDKDSVVEVVVSKGALTIDVPRLRGMTLDEARSTVGSLDLRLQVNEIPRERVGPFRRGQFGRVEEQSPAQGTIERGETIHVWTYSESAEQE